MKKPVIEFEGFSFRYKAQTLPSLKNITLTIYEGEKVLILGSSGSGKTTLANCVNGLIPFSYSGEITGSCKVKGRETRELSVFALSRDVGTALQDSDAQFVGLSVGEDMAFLMENDCVPREEMRRKVRENSRIVGMEDFLAALPFHLSGGQKQKAALGGILGEDTGILIFDEPLASLDPKTGTAAIDLIDQIVRRQGCTALIIEHRLEDVLFRPVDRVILMDKGEIAADTAPDALLRSGLLGKYGIREPLYLTAMKYAGCDIAQVPDLGDSSRLEIGGENREKLRAFFARETPPRISSLEEKIIRVEKVRYAYDEGGPYPAIQDASFSLRKGERVAFIGRNGAGKSTMAKLLCGICRPASGTIRLNGKDSRSLTVREIGGVIGYVMQDPNQMLVKDTIKDEVELALRLRKEGEERIREMTQTALETCDLYRMRNWPVDAVSYGQKKRITIASALAAGPEVLILDEPTAGQDYRHYTEILSFINRLNREYGKTVIFITHDIHLAIESTDRAVVFGDEGKGGVILADGDIFAILSDSRIVEAANLKATSLHALAETLDMEAEPCIRGYITYEEELKAKP
ncbi:MAG: ABC transporter ATP-binding protein [Treponema sp.]|nr:ABC transporter ATP-binding protein [Treponema sp.]